MATDTTELTAGSGRRYEEIKGRLFEYLLIGATLSGIVAVAALLVVVLGDALQLGTAEPAWYVVFLGGVAAPVVAFAAYCRQRPATAAVAKRISGLLAGSALLGATIVATVNAVSPYDVFLLLYAALLPALAAAWYARRNPAAAWAGPAVPVAVVAGLGLGALVQGPVVGVLAIAAAWIPYLAIVTLPVGVLVGWSVSTYWEYDRRTALATGALTVGSGVIAAVLGIVGGYDPVLGAVFVPAVLVPVGLYTAHTLRSDDAGRLGLLAPVVLLVGLGTSVVLVGQFQFAGPDAWLTVTLLTEAFSTLDPRRAGIYPQLVGSILLITVMAVVIFPVGVGAALYLEEYAPQQGLGGRVTQLIQVNISNLAAVPSVVYGLLGLGLFVGFLGMERGVLIAASITLGLLILPIVIVTSQEAIRAVPDSHREASYGMGASRWQTVREVVVPQAFPGILTATILALSRAIGETAPILLIGVATSKNTPPTGLFEKATALPLQIYASHSLPQPEYRYGVLAAAVVVLVGLMLVMNATAILLRNRYQRTEQL